MNQQRIFQIMDIADRSDLASKWFDIIFLSLITLNVIALMLETVTSIYTPYKEYFYYFELFSIIVFTIEFLLRIYTAPANHRVQDSKYPRLALFKTPMFLIDLLAILPFYVAALGIDLRALRILRLAKLFRYSHALQLFMRVFYNKREELLMTFIIMILFMIVSATGIYFAERYDQTEAFSSIPAALWWSVATLTTIGYGDVYPITTIGKSFATLVAISGIGMVALPTGILGAGFIEEIQSKKSNILHDDLDVCPLCQRNLTDHSG